MSEPILGFSKFVEMVQTFHMFISPCCTVNEEHAKILKLELETREQLLLWLENPWQLGFGVPMQDDVGGSERYWAPKLYIQQGIIWGLVPRASYFDHESTVILSENWIG